MTRQGHLYLNTMWAARLRSSARLIFWVLFAGGLLTAAMTVLPLVLGSWLYRFTWIIWLVLESSFAWAVLQLTVPAPCAGPYSPTPATADFLRRAVRVLAVVEVLKQIVLVVAGVGSVFAASLLFFATRVISRLLVLLYLRELCMRFRARKLARSIGWLCWYYLISSFFPSVLLVFTTPSLPTSTAFWTMAWIVYSVMAIGLFIWLLLVVAQFRRRITPASMDRCLNCGYPLQGLSEHRCPECGLPFP